MMELLNELWTNYVTRVFNIILAVKWAHAIFGTEKVRRCNRFYKCTCVVLRYIRFDIAFGRRIIDAYIFAKLIMINDDWWSSLKFKTKTDALHCTNVDFILAEWSLEHFNESTEQPTEEYTCSMYICIYLLWYGRL